jgi:hypothetical protein
MMLRNWGLGRLVASWVGYWVLVLLLVGPPLLMTLLWIAARPRRP